MEGRKFVIIASISVLLSGVSACTLPEDSSAGNANISLVATVTTTEVIKTVYVSGDYLYAAAGYNGLLVYHIVNPSNLVKVDTYADFIPVNDVIVKSFTDGSTYAFIPLGMVNDLGGMLILNVTSPSNVYLPAGHDTNDFVGYNSEAITVNDDLSKAYVADVAKGIVTYALAPGTTGYTVAAPVVKALNGKPENLCIANGYAYVAAKEGGVFIVNLTTGVIAANIFSSLSYANAVSVSGNTLVIADQFYGAVVYDISDPTKPKLKASYDTSGEARDIIVNGSDIFMADGSVGMLWLNIASSSSVVLKGRYIESTGIASKLFYSTDTTPYIYAAYGPAGIKIFKISGN